MGKIIAVIYSIVSYVLFFATALYLIGFVGDFIVPKTINSGLEISFIKAFLINLCLLSTFAVQHSLMARKSFKSWLTSFMNPAIERSTYVLLSSFALILLYWQWCPMKTVVWEVNNAIIYWIIMSVFILGWGLVFAATFMMNHFELTGLQQVYNHWRDKKTTQGIFKMSYMYKFVRHPLMLGFLIVFWATPFMTMGHFLFTVIMTFYILISVKYLEEKDLRKELGKAYERYQKEVPMLIPFTKKGERNRGEKTDQL